MNNFFARADNNNETGKTFVQAEHIRVAGASEMCFLSNYIFTESCYTSFIVSTA
jgi:hypothetical protein